MDKEAFVNTILPLRPMLLAKAQSMTGQSDHAEDLVQEVMLRLWDRRADFSRHPRPEALALTILRSRVTDEWRHLQTEREYQQRISRDALRQATEEPPADDMDTIAWIIAHLPPLQRRIFTMKEMEGYEASEIQEITGCSAESIRKNLSRARQRIRDAYITLTTRRNHP